MKAYAKSTAPSGLTRENAGSFPTPRPMYAPLVRVDSGVECEGCGLHVDTTAQCRCSA